MIKAGIIGATGYAGGELARLLLQREDVEVVWYGSRSYVDKKYASIYQNMFRLVEADCLDDNMKELAKEADVIFTATPQGLCASLVDEEILSQTKIIDLSADFRIKDVSVYEKWYKLEHKAPQFIAEAVYGLPEINREQVKRAFDPVSGKLSLEQMEGAAGGVGTVLALGPPQDELHDGALVAGGLDHAVGLGGDQRLEVERVDQVRGRPGSHPD